MRKLQNKNELDFFSLFQKLITDSKTGKRLQPNGKRLSKGSIKNYESTQLLLQRFCAATDTRLRIRPIDHLNNREKEIEKNYWKKFYRRFTDYLYGTCKHYDNYVGQNIKIIRVFFNYLNKELSMEVGAFHMQFYVCREEIAIFPLMPEELSFLIYNEVFEATLSPRLKEVKDFFVFGCTVALRVSDLFALTCANVRINEDNYYLAVRSQKSGADTLVKLPPYAISIIEKYKRKGGRLLPHFNVSNLNMYIKILLEKAQMIHEVSICHYRRGKPLSFKKEGVKNGLPRFCDVATTHTMRRTAITTMLSLGMPEQLVRKISGHAPHSSAFYRYVSWAQTYQDKEMERVFLKLKETGRRA